MAKHNWGFTKLAGHGKRPLSSHHYWMIDGQFRAFSSAHRYLWPAEPDLMARLAGLTLRERWSDWHRTPFTSESRRHISVWEKAVDSPQ